MTVLHHTKAIFGGQWNKMQVETQRMRTFTNPSPLLQPLKNGILIILLFIVAIAELVFGTVDISLGEVWVSLTHPEMSDENIRMIVLQSRLPRALTAIFAGSSLALGGMLMQTLFRNPLAGPSVLGVSSGASLGVAILLLSGGWMAGTSLTPAAIALAAIFGALLVLLVITFASKRLSDNTTLLIFGVMLSFFTGAIVDALQFHSTNDSLRKYITWGLGSFSGTSTGEIAIMAGATAIGLMAIVPQLRKLDIFLMGTSYAQSMGIDPSRTSLVLILITGLLAGVATAYCGPVAFIGLAVPHLIRSWFSTMIHRKIWIAIALTGAILAMVCDLISLLLNLPLNTVASALGAPVVIWIIIKGQRNNTIF